MAGKQINISNGDVTDADLDATELHTDEQAPTHNRCPACDHYLERGAVWNHCPWCGEAL